VPYNAALIAYEKMSAFAYISIVDGILKLLIVFLITVLGGDKLILYAILISLVAAGIRLTYGLYVKRHFPYCHNTWKLDKHVRKEMFSFVSWNLIGSTAGIVQQQGLSVLLNVFFGATVNAARGVSLQVMHAVAGFVSNFNLAMNPQIIKSYACGKKEEMFSLAIRGSKFSFMLMLILSAPIIIEAPYILNFWLVNVPEHSVSFVRIVLFISLVDSLKHTMVASVHASGHVKFYQLTNGIFSLMTIPVAYIILRLGYPPSSALYTTLFISLICHFIRLGVLWNIMRFPIIRYIRTVTLKMLFITLVTFSVPIYIYQKLTNTFFNFLIVSSITVLFSLIVCYAFGLSKSEKEFICDKVFKYIQRK
jgi:O-antigen/teichoic acid export membrane protein